MSLNRREFLTTAAGVTAALALGRESTLAASTPPAAPGSFDFVFFTDTHIQPELNAGHGCEMCFQKIAGIQSDFTIMGGDHVFDALAVDSTRAKLVFDLYQKTEHSIQQKIYQTIGNHDLFGFTTKSGVSPEDPLYGKKLYEDRFGKKTYYSFGYKGYHFLVLDSVQPTPDRMWEGRIDEAQLAWLVEDLKQVGPSVPVIGVTHVPLVTAFANYDQTVWTPQKYNTLTVANSAQVVSILQNYNLVAVLQGHLHINELVQYKNTKFLTGGAVCGNWWRGLRMGTPEGFTVVSLRDGQISTRYETYGFKAVGAPNK
jgi:3',5'-cyclic-AMP phosphodiesterase